MKYRAVFELLVLAQDVEVMRIPLSIGSKRIGGKTRDALRIGTIDGTLRVSRSGVCIDDATHKDTLLSATPLHFGEVALAIDSLAVDDITTTQDHPTTREDAQRIRFVDARDDRVLAHAARGEVAIGTNASCAVLVSSAHVSRVHCAVFKRDGLWFVRDSGSKNGTFLNGVRVSESELVPPANLRVGDRDIRVELADEGGHSSALAPAIVGRSPAIATLLRHIERFAPGDETVLITGESGSGKELVARALHEGSARRTKPFVAVNCGALAPTLIESELFGHLRGSFTGASERRLGAFVAANGGVLFLDEIGELPLHLQPMLLRVLETREVRAVGDDKATPVNLRVIAATHRDLRQALSVGKFREDLFHRLNVLRLNVPPLRERGRDIILLARHFLRALAPDRLIHLSPETAERLVCHPFSGNVRELKNVLQRALYLCDGEVLLPQHIELERAPIPAPPRASVDLASMERNALLHALRDAHGSRSEAARKLGIARSTMYRKLQFFGIVPEEIFR